MSRKKRRSAWGSVTEVSPGVWRIRFWAEGPGGYRRRSRTVRGSRKEAEAARAQLLLEHGEDAPCPTVAEAWERWALPTLAARAADGDLAEKTLYRYERVWAHDVEPVWGPVPLDEVRPLKVQQWISGMTLSVAKVAVVVLSAVMDHAVRYEVVGHNPMREKYLMPSRSTVARRDEGIWSLAELEDVWGLVRGLWFEPAFILAAFGGLRVGESLGPLAGEVSLREVGGVPVALVPVARQVPDVGAPTERLKTRWSRRTVAIPGKAALRLSELASALPADWFLTNDGGTGTWRPQSALGSSWGDLSMEHPFKNLRNSWQTWMRWELRVAPHFIEAMMGHKREGVTGAHYDRPDADLFAEVVADAYRARPFDADWLP